MYYYYIYIHRAAKSCDEKLKLISKYKEGIVNDDPYEDILNYMESFLEVKKDLMWSLDGEYTEMQKNKDYYEKGDKLDKNQLKIMNEIKSQELTGKEEVDEEAVKGKEGDKDKAIKKKEDDELKINKVKVDKAINKAQTELDKLENGYFFQSFMVSRDSSNMIYKKKMEEYIHTLKKLEECGKNNWVINK